MDSNFTRIGYVAETTFGTTPSAALQLVRTTGGGLQPRQSTTSSEEIRADLRSSKPVRTGQWSQGEFGVEWSYGLADDFLQALLGGTWTTNVLLDGTVKRSFTLEQSFIDTNISPDQYLIHKGCRVEQITMQFALGAIVKGTLGFLGATPSIAQATVGNGTHTAPGTQSQWNCTDMVTDIEEGTALGTNITRVTGIDLTIRRALRPNFQIGSLNPFDIGTGRLHISGQITQYFETDTLLDAWFAFESRAIMVQASSNGANQVLKIELPKVKYTGDPQVNVPGPDGDCMVTMNFEAYADVGDAHMIRVTRTP